MWRRCCRERELRARVIHIGQLMHEKFPTNVIRNQKYNIVTFLPLVKDIDNYVISRHDIE